MGVASALILLGAAYWKTTKGRAVAGRSVEPVLRRARKARRLERESRRPSSDLEGRARVLDISPIQKEEQVMAARKGRHEHEGSVDAMTLLKRDHDEVSDLLKQFESADSAGKGSIAERICAALTVHAHIEEEIFYPAARRVLDADDMDLLDEADIEHATIKGLVKRIQASSPADDHFEALVTVLGEYVKHHVKEEEKQLFPKVRRTDLDLDGLGAKLMARKEQLQAAPETAGAK
jgi:hemerythrin superfamily protein